MRHFSAYSRCVIGFLSYAPTCWRSCCAQRAKSVVRDKVLRRGAVAQRVEVRCTWQSPPMRGMIIEVVTPIDECEVRCTWQSPPTRGMILEVVTPNDEWYHVVYLMMSCWYLVSNIIYYHNNLSHLVSMCIESRSMSSNATHFYELGIGIHGVIHERSHYIDYSTKQSSN